MSALAVKPPDAAAIEKVILGGDLKDLNPAERLAYYNRVCESLSLNPLTQPFAYMNLSGKLTLYARKDAAEQLRKVNSISLRVTSREVLDGMYVVTCEASTPTGRLDASTGVIDISKLTGEAKANAMMKAETKAKRRVTLSICGLGLIDETEVDSVPGARKVTATDAHSDTKMLEAPAADVPDELKDVIGKLRAGDKSVIGPACKFVEEEMLTLGLGEAYAQRASGLRSSFPKGKAIPFGAMEDFLLNCWDEVVAARAKNDAVDDKSDWVPDFAGGEKP